MVAVFAGSVGLVVYTFLGYPALVGLMARVAPRPPRRDLSFVPRVSLIIAAHNEADVIEQKLRNTAELDYPADRLEVIVVADGSDDDTPDRSRAFPGTRVLFQPERRGKLAAITRAADVAGGEALVFSDANNDYSPNTLRELVAPLADPAVGIVTGRKTIQSGSGRSLDQAEGLYWRYESKLKEWESAIGSVTAVAGEVLAFRPEAFYATQAGMLTEDFVQAMLGATRGWRVVYAPDAVSLEPASATLQDEATRRARIVTGRWQAITGLLPEMARRDPRLAWQVVSHKGLRPLVPLALAAAAGSNLALVRRRAWARWTGAGQVAFYVTAAVGREQERRGRRNRLTYLPYYFCRMNAATLNGFRRFVTRQRDAVWTRVARG